MKPYFLTHPVGLLYSLVLLVWYSIELRQYFRQRQWRQSVPETGPRNFWAALWISAGTATVMLIVAPTIAPGAQIGPQGTLFATGLAMLVAGAALRVWSIKTLGTYFTFTVRVSPDQPVVAAGPYRVLRHPGYAGGLLASIGIGVVYDNWVSLATITVLFTAIIVWRILVEERALLATLADTYGGYAAHHKRLVPLVW